MTEMPQLPKGFYWQASITGASDHSGYDVLSVFLRKEKGLADLVAGQEHGLFIRGEYDQVDIIRLAQRILERRNNAEDWSTVLGIEVMSA